MNRNWKRDVVAFVCWIGVAALAAASTMLAAGCAGGPAATRVAEQNESNAEAYATNVATLAAAARELALRQAAAMRRDALERVSADLIRVRSMIPLATPTAAELADGAASWTRGLQAESSALAARINAALPDRRVAAASELAGDHAATIDLAIASPGFTPERVLRDAVMLDGLNEQIERESSLLVRGGLLQRRDTILSAYLAAQLAGASAERFTGAIDRLVATLDQQGAVLGLHAAALRTYAAGGGRATMAGMVQNAELRSAAIDLVGQVWGTTAADDVRERLRRLDDAFAAVRTVSR